MDEAEAKDHGSRLRFPAPIRPPSDHAAEGLLFLAEASRLLGSSLDYEQTLRSLARLAVPRLGDWCAIEMRVGDDDSQQLEVAHVDPKKVELAAQMRRMFPPDRSAPTGVFHVLRTGEPLLYEEVPDSLLERTTKSPEHLAIARALGLRSAMIVPLIARERVLGAITLVAAESGRRYGPADLALVLELAARAALAVDNARLYRESREELARRTHAELELSAAKQQLDLILEGVADGLTAQEPSGSLVYANDAAARTIGFESAAELIATPVADVLGRFEVLDPDGAPLPYDRLPSALARAGEEPPEALVRFRVRATGEERWSVLRSTPVLGPGGEVRLVINFFRDVTAEHRARQRERLLADATAQLGKSLDYSRTLARLARLLVPALADWCVVYASDGRTITPIEVAHVDPEKAAWAREMATRYPSEPSAPAGVGRVIRTAEPSLVPHIDDAMLEHAARDPEHLAVLRRLGLASSVIVPLATHERVLGAIALMSAESGRHYDEADLAFAMELARRAAIAVDNARLYAEAQAAIQLRDEFLSIASHELKTPLTSIELTMSGLVRAAELGRVPSTVESLETMLGPAKRQLRRLTALIDELLDASRVQGGRLTIARHEMDLAELAHEVAARFVHDAVRARCELSVDAPVAIVGVWDRERLDQVLTNLVANALKYGAGEVRLRVSRDEVSAHVEVSDQGPGIDPADQARIFERFERAATPNLAGLGLGLWIVRELVSAHSGEVRVTSAPGVGSVFTVVLPIDPGAVDAHDHDRR